MWGYCMTSQRTGGEHLRVNPVSESVGLVPIVEGEFTSTEFAVPPWTPTATVTCDTGTDQWTVTDDSFETGGALYLSNQDPRTPVWGGSAFPGRGVPGRTDRLERWEQE